MNTLNVISIIISVLFIIGFYVVFKELQQDD